METETPTLLSRFRDGDEEAFWTLFDAHAPFLQARIRHRLAPLLRRKVSIADVLQETRIVAFERRDTFDGQDRDDFRKWLLGIADLKARQVVDAHADTKKRAVNREVSKDRRIDTAHFTGQGPSPSQEAMANELDAFAREALANLPLPGH